MRFETFQTYSLAHVLGTSHIILYYPRDKSKVNIQNSNAVFRKILGVFSAGKNYCYRSFKHNFLKRTETSFFTLLLFYSELYFGKNKLYTNK